jgi:hypothetical protein
MSDKPLGTPPDQRDAERVPMLGALQGEIMVLEPLVIREISIQGATIETRFPLQLNSLHDLRVALGATRVVVKGRVVHARISEVDQDVVTYRSGVEFVELPERVAAALTDFLNTVKTERTGV